MSGQTKITTLYPIEDIERERLLFGRKEDASKEIENTLPKEENGGSAYVHGQESDGRLPESLRRIESAVIELEPSVFVYDGQEKRPSVKVTDGPAVLTANDYNVSYSDNIGIGTASVTVTGKGHYAGSVSKHFVIKEKNVRSGKKTVWAVLLSVLFIAVVTGIIIAVQPKNQGSAVLETDLSETTSETESQETSVKQSSVKQSSVKQESVKQESVKQESVKQESVKQESVQQESVKQESVSQETSVYTPVTVTSQPTKPVVSSQPAPSQPSQAGDEASTHEKVITSLSITRSPYQLQYEKGEAMDITGLLLEAKYDDNSVKAVDVNDCIVGGFDASSAGTKTITVTFQGKTASFTVEVLEPSSGTCGSNLTYDIDRSGTLTIRGSGRMDDYDESPFNSGTPVKKVVFENGAVNVGGYAFCECESLAEVQLPDSLKKISYCAFSDCIALQTVTVPDGVTTIGDNAFGGCKSLEKMVIPNSVTSIDPTAFDDCGKLTIYGQKDSFAERFAKENNIAFQYMASVLETVSSGSGESG